VRERKRQTESELPFIKDHISCGQCCHFVYLASAEHFSIYQGPSRRVAR
jgi:hypothetical protein